MQPEQAEGLVAVRACLTEDLLGHQPRATAGGLGGELPPARLVHASSAVDHAGHVGAGPDRLSASLRENPVLVGGAQRVEVRLRVGTQVIGRILTRRDVDAVAIRYNQSIGRVPALGGGEVVDVAAPCDPAKLDHAIKLYLAGKPQKEILTWLGISSTSLHRERTRRGIPPRREIGLPDAEIAAAYLGGQSEYALSLRFKVSRNVIRRRLELQGVEIRDMSTAGKVRAAQMTPEARKFQARNANLAWKPREPKEPRKSSGRIPKQRVQPYQSRGKLVAQPTYVAADGRRRYTDEFLVANALNREVKRSCHSAADALMESMLAERGLSPIAQKAIGKYNVDVAVAPVAVEVLGGGWHMANRHHATRTPAILDAGWHMLFVWDHEGYSALGPGAADYVVAFLDEIRRNPPTVSQYRVISGNGQFLSAGSRDDDEFALVPPPRGSKPRRPRNHHARRKAPGVT